MVSFLLAGCGLKFGDDYTLDAASFDTNSLDTVANVSRLQLPDGVRGLNMVYRGSGIDPALIAKLEIPPESASNLVFQISSIQGKSKASASETLTRGHSWWTEKSLTVEIHKKLILGSEYLELIFGKEEGKWILLVKWFTV